ncbi:MAG TPA: BPL-N domain-containing protein [Micromonospora sp.]|nr:BPL-N domain-containing protein [Micromonospora sp.]
MNRRQLLIGAGAVAALAGLGGVSYSVLSEEESSASKIRPLALVYRGPAACFGCSESVAALLRSSPIGFRTKFCGPDEEVQLSAGSLSEAVVYAQPGGDTLRSAWRLMRGYAPVIRDFVNGGGHYLGFCLGAYLAADNPGFGLLSGIAVSRYIYRDGASVQTKDDTVIHVRWRGRLRHMYFQDGNFFRLEPHAPALVLATYDTGEAAAIVTAYGAGQLGLVGPHPEADESWYTGTGLTNPDGVLFDLGHDLVESTIRDQSLLPPPGPTAIPVGAIR